MNGNIQTASLVIEQGAMFEGSCKMIKVTTGTAKAKVNGRDVEPLDTSSIKSIAADSTSDSTEIPKISSVAN